MKRLITILTIAIATANCASGQTPEIVTSRGATGLSSANGKIFFQNADTIWITDGTPNGTLPVKKIPQGKITRFIACNGKTFFMGPTIDNGDFELWITDGTESGTVVVKDINASDGGCIDIFQPFNNKLYFIGDDGVNGQELWVTDGTLAGTTMVKDINTGSNHGLQSWSHSIIYNGKLYFSANDGVNGEELWTTDGTSAGTVMVKDIHPSGSSTPNTFAIFSSKLYFRATDNTNGNELWVTDGTAGGTALVKDINPGTGSSYISGLTSFNGKLYFTASAGFNFDVPYNIWQSDGTSSGTTVFEDSAMSLHVYKGQLYFGKISGYTASSFDYALYKTDGTALSTVKVKNIDGGNSKHTPSYYTEVGGNLYFLCNHDNISGGANYLDNDLWITDGTAANTKLIRHASNSLVNVFVKSTNMIEYNGSLYFTQSNKLYKIAGVSTDLPSITSNEIDLSLYPNPANSIINIETAETIISVQVFNTIGELVQKETLPVFSIAQLQSGFYFVSIKTEKGVVIKRVMKE